MYVLPQHLQDTDAEIMNRRETRFENVFISYSTPSNRVSGTKSVSKARGVTKYSVSSQTVKIILPYTGYGGQGYFFVFRLKNFNLKRTERSIRF